MRLRRLARSFDTTLDAWQQTRRPVAAAPLKNVRRIQVTESWRTAKLAIVRRQRPPVSARSRYALDAVNFFLAGLTGIGSPFLSNLLRDAGWSYGAIGMAAAMPGLGVCLLQAVAGFYLDRARHARVILAAASIAVGACYALLPSLVRGTHLAVLGTLFGSGLAQALFGPLLAGLALGLVGHAHINRTAGANQAFCSLGDVAAAVFAFLVIRHGIAQVFYLVGVYAMLAAASALLIKEQELDRDRAAGGTEEPVPFRVLLRHKTVVAFIASTMLFYTAYASAFPFITLRARQAHGTDTTVAAMILVTQACMVPVAAVTGPLLGALGRKPVLGFGFVSLAVYLLICVFVKSPVALVGVQALGSVGPGILAVALVVVCADLTRGTGHFQALIGATRTAMVAGSVLGTFATGFVVGHLGYAVAISLLTSVAVASAFLFLTAMPETRPLPVRELAPQ
jgi:MFS family permease